MQRHGFVRAATGDIYSVCRMNNDERVYDFSGCSDGRVINITSAIVGWSREWKWVWANNRRQLVCYIYTDRTQNCGKRTNSPEIMQCDGHQRCNHTVDAFNYPENFRCQISLQSHRRGHYIVIKYNCVNGKKI